jgi:hypothetical protein
VARHAHGASQGRMCTARTCTPLPAGPTDSLAGRLRLLPVHRQSKPRARTRGHANMADVDAFFDAVDGASSLTAATRMRGQSSPAAAAASQPDRTGRDSRRRAVCAHTAAD